MTVFHMLGVVLSAFSAAGVPLEAPIGLAEAWKTDIQGPWRVRYDHRDLMAMRHPWQPSEKGNFALAWRMVRVPEDWEGPVSLTFYCSDDYHTDMTPPAASWLTAEGFVEHRFKQVLVDKRVVWSQDVADPVVKGASHRFRVPLEVAPGQLFQLGLLTYDAEASGVVLEHDYYQPGDKDSTRETDPKAANFMTHVYWGDFVLVRGDAPPRPGRRPSEANVLAVHKRRWPLAPFGDGWNKATARLEVSAPAGIPKTGFPVQCGIPLPAGKVSEPNAVRLQTTRERAVFAQKSVLGRWPDDSLRWILADFLAKADTKSLDLAFGKDEARAPAKAQCVESEKSLRVRAGATGFEVRSGEGIVGVAYNTGAKIDRIRLGIRIYDEAVEATTDFIRVVSEGPFRVTVALEGRFDALDRQVGSFSLYCSAYAGLPYLKFWFRLFNDSGQDLPVSGLTMSFDLHQAPVHLKVPGAAVKDGFTLSQTAEKIRLLDGEPVEPLAPQFLAWDGGGVVVKHFRELFPKAVSVEGKQVIVDLAAAGVHPVIFTPGEAKSHEVWLALDDTDPEQLARTVRQPPILQNPVYYCATGVLGRARPHEGVPKLAERMAETYQGKDWADLGQQYGLRDFPDSPYYGGLPNWSNNYYERMLGLWSEWFMSGGRAWFDRAVAVCEHLMDVAIVHAEVPGQEWLGALHGPGKNHVSGPWNPTLRIAGLELYHKLTGAPEAREAFLGVADYCVRSAAGIDGGSVRQQAGPFDAICSGYIETGEVSFIDDGTTRVESVLRAVDRRRGVWPDEHGSRVYRGNVPWMVAQAARPLYWWYYLSGDIEAAQALVGLAESIVCENTDWDAPGVVAGYSHNPQYGVSAVYDPLIIPVIFAAYEFTEDPFFLDAARAQWQRWVGSEDFDSVFNTYWNTPWLIWYLDCYKAALAVPQAAQNQAQE